MTRVDAFSVTKTAENPTFWGRKYMCSLAYKGVPHGTMTKDWANASPRVFGGDWVPLRTHDRFYRFTYYEKNNFFKIIVQLIKNVERY